MRIRPAIVSISYMGEVQKALVIYIVLWQPLNQCLIAVQAINLKGGYLVGNISCVIYKRT